MRSRLRNHDGANAVEFALILPILVVLIFGGIHGGLALNHDLSLSTAAREGARFGATLQGTNDGGVPASGWFTQILDRVTIEAAGSLNSNVPTSTICVAFVPESGTARRVVRSWASGSPQDTQQSGPCLSDGITGQPRVQVSASRQIEINAVLITPTATIGSEAIARYEKVLE